MPASPLSSGTSLSFRHDVNGLRAFAVATVLLFHFDVPGFSAGFVGVDIFFVLSGYLMTSIIMRQSQPGAASIASFYLARARRILPALVALCAVLLLLGWFWLDAPDYRALGSQAGSSLLFFSNLVFLGDVGYFDTEVHEKWLLHTWSLSVEWQFYILYPLLLLVLVRYARPWTAAILTAIAALSLGYYFALGGPASSSAFYLLLPRAWELLAGALVYMAEPRLRAWQLSELTRRCMELAGIALVVLGAAGITGPLPSPLLAPVAGAVLVLLAARQGSAVMANPISHAMGQWSYSIYLWHWPLLVAALYVGLERTAGLTLALLTVSVLLGALSYRFVEEPFRHGVLRARMGLPGFAALAVAVAMPAGILVLANGLPGRHGELLRNIEEQALKRRTDVVDFSGKRCRWNKRSKELVPCRIGDSKVPATIAVWGDSHANRSRPSVESALSSHGLSAYFYFSNGCRPLQGLQTKKGVGLKDCVAFNRAVLEHISANKDIKTVILIANWSYDVGAGKIAKNRVRTSFGKRPLTKEADRYAEYAEHMVRDMCALRTMGREVMVTAPVPYFGKDIPRDMARSLILSGKLDIPRIPRAVHVERNRVVFDALGKAQDKCGIKILDPLRYFCDDTTCAGAKDNKPIYSDDNHLSPYGNELVRPMFDEAFRNVMPQSRDAAIQ